MTLHKHIPVSSDDYQDACDNNMGWCPICQEFSREQTEPDAEKYDCEDCGESQAMGAEMASLQLKTTRIDFLSLSISIKGYGQH